MSSSTGFTRHLPTVARVLMGLMFFVFGLNGFLNFIPPPPPDAMPEASMAFAGAMMKTGYLFQLVKGTEVLVGVLLLLNRFVPLALALIAPVVVNILAFHAFLAPSGVAMPIVILLIELYLAWSYRAVYRPMLAAKVSPNSESRGPIS
jgi:uncharacterized membrane protein YphA (DoxX/SURF4 family)